MTTRRSPRYSSNQLRKSRVEFSVSDDEKKKISEYASLGNMSLSEYCRDKAMKAPISKKYDRVHMSNIARIIVQLDNNIRRIGNNLNQIAKNGNQNKEISADIENYKSEIESLLNKTGRILDSMDKIEENKNAGKGTN